MSQPVVATMPVSDVGHLPFSRRISPAPIGGGFAMDGYWVWCGSAAQGEDGRYHLFAARWPKHLKFLPAYQSYSEIVHASADKPSGPYHFESVVLPDRGPQYWDGRMTHNPTVLKTGGRYALFYIGTTFQGERPGAAALETGPAFWPWYRQIRIGVATADTIHGPWTRRDTPYLLARPGMWDEHVVTNPAPCLAADGRLFLYYRSYIKGCGNRIGLAIFEGLDGKCLWRSEKPLFDIPGTNLEDPFVWQQGDHFEMIAKDLNGSLCGEYHGGIHLLSRDGIHWGLAPVMKAYSRDVLWDDGRTWRLGSLERPQLLFHNNSPTHLFAAMADGPGNWQEMTRTWTGVIPLRVT